jgi:hypothetical protein
MGIKGFKLSQIADKLPEADYEHKFIKLVAACTISEQGTKLIITDQMRGKWQRQW